MFSEEDLLPESALPPPTVEDDVCALPLVRRACALLDGDVAAWRDGMALPRGWHFMLFAPVLPLVQLGVDGMPQVDRSLVGPGEFRIMLGGRTMGFCGDIPIGARVYRRASILSVTPKQGRTGSLVLVKRLHEIFVEGAVTAVVREEEDMVLRGSSPNGSGSPPDAPDPRQAEFTAPFRPTETHLFRYSAITNNAHRIHYDRPYATGVEGYRGVVVNGGLTGLMLLELFRKSAGREANSIATRNIRPLFCGETASLNGRREGDLWRLWALDRDGMLAMELTIR